MSNIVIIGAGHAGSRTAEHLIKLGCMDKIYIFGEEKYYPYERPPLSKGFLLGEKKIIDFTLFSQNFFDTNNISLSLNNKINKIDISNKQVIDANNKKLNFDKLIFANGSSPKKINFKNIEGIYYLRNIKDSITIKKNIIDKNHIVILGGGFIGLEIASIIKKKYDKKKITIIEASPNILSRNSNEYIRKILYNLHIENKIDINLNTQIKDIIGENHINKIVFTNGKELKTDMLIVGIGVYPNTDILENQPIDLLNGIKVNEYCETNIKDIYAVGDVACYKSIFLDQHIREESWNNAEKQAQIVAANITGQKKIYNEIPWFWTDQYENNFQIIGQIDNFDKVLVRTYDQQKLIYFFLRNDRIKGAFAINNGRDIKITKKIIEKNDKKNFEEVQDLNYNLKNLIK